MKIYKENLKREFEADLPGFWDNRNPSVRRAEGHLIDLHEMPDELFFLEELKEDYYEDIKFKISHLLSGLMIYCGTTEESLFDVVLKSNILIKHNKTDWKYHLEKGIARNIQLGLPCPINEII